MGKGRNGKMKNKYLKSACVLALACVVLVTLIGASSDPEVMSVKQLLAKRTDIMENVLSGKISIEEGKEQLKEIETDKLYHDDVNNLKSNMNCEHNKVIGMKITDMSKIKDVSDLTAYEGNIVWECSGIDGLYTQECSYIIGVDSSSGNMKLVSFELVE